MKIINYKSELFQEWLEMSHQLLTDYKEEELALKLKRIESSEKHQTFFAESNETIIGYATASIRTDYVEGCLTSPTGYLEMIYVKESYRMSGAAKNLLEATEKWAIKKGCYQMGSDTWEWNKNSRVFHKKMGFSEEEVLVHFIKNISK